MTTGIADSASLAIDAIAPSWRRRTRAWARTRRRKAKLIAASAGVVAKRGERHDRVDEQHDRDIPTTSSSAWAIAPSDCENRSPIALTSPVTRVTRSPFWLRWWKPSESRCRCVVDGVAQLVGDALAGALEP